MATFEVCLFIGTNQKAVYLHLLTIISTHPDHFCCMNSVSQCSLDLQEKTKNDIFLIELYIFFHCTRKFFFIPQVKYFQDL